MVYDFKKAYEEHYNTFIKNYFKDFEDNLSHAPEPQYFITIFQEKSKQQKSLTYQESRLNSTISEIDNKLSLDDRISFIDLVRNYCDENKRDLLQTLHYIAEIKALDEIWRISERRRKIINYDSFNSAEENSQPIPMINSQITSDSKLKRNKIPKSKNSFSEKLVDIFSDFKKYELVKQQLIEENYLTDNPLTWTHQGKANKLILCALLYDLQKKGYYNLTIFPTPTLLQAIALNTFNLKISTSTFKDKNSITRFKSKFNFIKYSASI